MQTCGQRRQMNQRQTEASRWRSWRRLRSDETATRLHPLPQRTSPQTCLVHPPPLSPSHTRPTPRRVMGMCQYVVYSLVVSICDDVCRIILHKFKVWPLKSQNSESSFLICAKCLVEYVSVTLTSNTHKMDFHCLDSSATSVLKNQN